MRLANSRSTSTAQGINFNGLKFAKGSHAIPDSHLVVHTRMIMKEENRKNDYSGFRLARDGRRPKLFRATVMSFQLLCRLTFAVFLTQFPSNRACYAKMDFYMLSINVPLTYKIIGLGPKRPCSDVAYKQHTRKSANSHT